MCKKYFLHIALAGHRNFQVGSGANMTMSTCIVVMTCIPGWCMSRVTARRHIQSQTYQLWIHDKLVLIVQKSLAD